MLVPAIFPFELQNILWTGERRQRINAADATSFWASLAEFDIRIDAPPSVKKEAGLLTIARSHGLTAYDAAYLELATRAALPLATLDERLQAAAKTTGIVLAL